MYADHLKLQKSWFLPQSGSSSVSLTLSRRFHYPNLITNAQAHKQETSNTQTHKQDISYAHSQKQAISKQTNYIEICLV